MKRATSRAEASATSSRSIGPRTPSIDRLARWVLVSFLVTFIVTRCVVLLILARRLPDLFLYVGGTHIHHLNFGIILLSGVGGYLLLFNPPPGRYVHAAVGYGIGLALTFDEFGMWLHLGGGYWQRASFDAVAVIAALLTLLAFAPRWRNLRPGHGWIAAILVLAVGLFVVLVYDTSVRLGQAVGPALRALEGTVPSP